MWRRGHRTARWPARTGRGRGWTSAVRIALVALASLLVGCTPPGLPDPIAPTEPTVSVTTPPDPGTVVVGLSGGPGQLTGFNPYRIADYSLASLAVAQLVLPSPFVITPEGSPARDPDVVDAARVTDTEPYTVTYTLDANASWSDGTPISADDFTYLWTELVTQPGTFASAGYRLIQEIRSRDAGKTVDVVFGAPVPSWPTMFSPLLPSRLMKDFPGGWAGALAGSIPVSGNRYRFTGYDSLTGQVSLRRNDKYWAEEPAPPAVILRLGQSEDLLPALDRGDVQAVWMTPDRAGMDAVLSGVPAELRAQVPTPATTQLVLQAAIGPTADPLLRRAVAAALAPDELRQTLTGGWADGALPVASQVRLPAQGDPGPGPPPIVTDDPAEAESLLRQAGYRRDGLYATRDGEVLRLRLSAPAGDPRTAATARQVQAQLGAAGIEVDVILEPPAAAIAGLGTGDRDAALLPVRRGIDDAVAAATSFSCPAGATAETGDVAGDPLVPADPDESEGVASGSPPASDADPDGQDAAPAASDSAEVPSGGNLAGYCSAALQPDLADALTGAGDLGGADAQLWSDLPVLPIAQPVTVFAVAPELATVLAGPRTGWLWTGPLVGLPDWPIA